MPTIAMPGVRAPTGGTYEECYDLGETTNVRVTVQRGEPLPQLRQGHFWRLVERSVEVPEKKP